METLVEIEGKEVGLKASAGTVRAYRDECGRDLILDMGTVEADILGNKTLSIESTAIAENVVYLMAKEYDSELPPIKEWLDQFSPYFVYSAVVHVINMWHKNISTRNETRKK